MEGVVKKKFPNTMKLSHLRVCGEFWNLRGQHNREENTHTPTPTHTPTHTHTQNTHLTATPSGELAQTLAFATREQGLNREALVACLG